MSDEMQTPNTSNSESNATTIGSNVTTGKDFVDRDLTVQGDKIDE